MYHIKTTLHMTLCHLGLLSGASSLRLTNINMAKEEQLSESGEEQSAYRVKNATF